jgi:drug/metabolite transporter (DMT)-like permease
MLIFRYPFFGYERNTVAIFIIYGIGVQVIGWFLINFSQGHLPASVVAPTLLGQPLVTAFLALILLHEHLTAWHISGGLVIIAGIYLIHFTRMRSGSRH